MNFTLYICSAFIFLLLLSVHVEKAMSPREDGFLEALSAETTILRKRVAAASSRCILESSFLNKQRSLLPGIGVRDTSLSNPTKKEKMEFLGSYTCACLIEENPYYCSGVPKHHKDSKNHDCIDKQSSKYSSLILMKRQNSDLSPYKTLVGSTSPHSIPRMKKKSKNSKDNNGSTCASIRMPGIQL